MLIHIVKAVFNLVKPVDKEICREVLEVRIEIGEELTGWMECSRCLSEYSMNISVWRPYSYYKRFFVYEIISGKLTPLELLIISLSFSYSLSSL